MRSYFHAGRGFSQRLSLRAIEWTQDDIHAEFAVKILTQEDARCHSVLALLSIMGALWKDTRALLSVSPSRAVCSASDMDTEPLFTLCTLELVYKNTGISRLTQKT